MNAVLHTASDHVPISGSFRGARAAGQTLVSRATLLFATLLLGACASFSPDALTGMEANYRFVGPETMETKIFGRLSAWQNWIFQRPNAAGDQGALKLYGTGQRSQFDKKRV